MWWRGDVGRCAVRGWDLAPHGFECPGLMKSSCGLRRPLSPRVTRVHLHTPNGSRGGVKRLLEYPLGGCGPAGGSWVRRSTQFNMSVSHPSKCMANVTLSEVSRGEWWMVRASGPPCRPRETVPKPSTVVNDAVGTLHRRPARGIRHACVMKHTSRSRFKCVCLCACLHTGTHRRRVAPVWSPLILPGG